MAMDEDLLFIGCAEGIIRCFRAGRLDFVATLPLPHHLGVDVSDSIENRIMGLNTVIQKIFDDIDRLQKRLISRPYHHTPRVQSFQTWWASRPQVGRKLLQPMQIIHFTLGMFRTSKG